MKVGYELSAFMVPTIFFYQKIQFHEVSLKNCLVLHAKRNVSGSSNKVSGIRQETWREDDPSFRKILEGGSSSRHMFSVLSLHAKSCTCH